MANHLSARTNAKEYRTFEFHAEAFSGNVKLLERAAYFRMADHP
jgi:hypothetical protein